MNHLLPAVLNIRGLLVQLRPGRGYDNPSVFGFFILLFIVPIAIVSYLRTYIHAQGRAN